MKGHTVVPALLGALVCAQPAKADETCDGVHTAGAAKLTVNVANLRAPRGQVVITVYPDDKRRFMAPRGKLARVRIPATVSPSACFWLPPATYAVAIYHDADGDGHFDRNLVGLPAEGFGLSNNPETKIGLPPFSSVRFRLPPGEASISVHLKYLR